MKFIRILGGFVLCFLVVAAITIACVASANSANEVRLQQKILAVTAHEDARSRYQIHTRFIFDEIDFRDAQAKRKLVAAEEYEAGFISKDTTVNILLVAAAVQAVAFLIVGYCGSHAHTR